MQQCNDYDELLQGSTPEEKLKSSLEILESLEKECFKLRAEVKRSEVAMKKLQESNAMSAQNQHNTSSAFALPSEFKKTWEILIQENILDLFSQFLGSHRYLVLVVQELIKEILKQVGELIDAKILSIVSLLGCPASNSESIKKHLLRLFQDHSSTAFPMLSLEELRKTYLARIPLTIREEVSSSISTGEFDSFVRNMHKISLHMLLNEPRLEINFTESIEYVVIDKPDNFYCIDGFPNGSPEAVIVVPSVMRNNYPYTGIKPAVLIITEESKNDLPQPSKVPEECLKEPTPTKKLAKDLSPSQVIDLYCRYKKNIYRNKNLNKYEDNQEAYPPLQKKTKENDFSKCTQCKGSVTCSWCSKSNLLALVKRTPSATNSQRHLTPARVYNNSLFDTPGRTQTRTMTSLLTKRLSEAAKKMDRKTLIKNKHIDKESCKVM